MIYRNNVTIISIQGIEIDEGSLWKFDPKQNLMVLVDDDQYITAKPNDKQFTKTVLH